MIKFIDQTHCYLNENGDQYRSVTSILKKLEPKKDWEKITRNYAKKHNLTVEEVKALWQLEKDISIERGKKAHALKEKESLSCSNEVILGIELPVIAPEFESDGVKYNNSMKMGDGIYPEVILWLNSSKIAGQADRIEIVNGEINVLDYKSNKKIDMEGFRNYLGETEKLVFPCAHMDNCNFNIYSLQLNMYAYMVKRHNPSLKIGKMSIIHLLFEDPDDREHITGQVVYEVPDLQKEVLNIIMAVQNNQL